MATLALIGPGAIGCVLAAWLLRAGRHTLTVAARTPFERLQVNTPQGIIDEPVQLWPSPEATHPVDWVLVATKTYDVEGTVAWLRGLVGPETRVTIVQNGVEHRERFAGIVPDDRLVPVVIDLPCERSAPGCVLQRTLGRMTVADAPAGRAFAGLWQGTPFDLDVTADFPAAMWRKLCVNSVGILNTLLLQGPEIFQREDLAAVARGMVAEVVAVARAEGVALGDDMPERILAGCRAAPAGSLNSMHADRLAGRPMELDARNGVILRKAARHGIDVPYHRATVALLAAAAGMAVAEAGAP